MINMLKHVKPAVGEAYVSPIAEIIPQCPEGALCLSAEGGLDDFEVTDYLW